MFTGIVREVGRVEAVEENAANPFASSSARRRPRPPQRLGTPSRSPGSASPQSRSRTGRWRSTRSPRRFAARRSADSSRRRRQRRARASGRRAARRAHRPGPRRRGRPDPRVSDEGIEVGAPAGRPSLLRREGLDCGRRREPDDRRPRQRAPSPSALIPHTRDVTTLGSDAAEGDEVNLEVDVVAKYVERLAAR